LRRRADPPFALVHIPKTGGSSLIKMIRRAYGERLRKPPNAIFDPLLAEEKLSRLAERAGGAPQPAVVGHIVFGMRDLLPRHTRYATVLREPVERTLSHYAHLVARRPREEGPHGLLARGTPCRPQMSLQQCLDDPRYLPDNIQTRMIVGRRSLFEPLPPDALEQAKKHLKRRFAFVGVTERLDELVALLTVELGWPSMLPLHARSSRGRLTRADLTPAQVRAIHGANRLDVELHEFAHGLFGRAVEARAAEVGLALDVSRRAGERAAGAAPVEHRVDEHRARLVEARAELVLAEAKIDLLQRKLAHAKRKVHALKEPAGEPPRQPVVAVASGDRLASAA
jgi:hypothetical protein